MRVMLRVRPLLPSEAERGETVNATVLPDCRSVMITAQMSSNRKVESQQHLFDYCFGPNATQEHVFEECGVKDMVHSALEGIASTVLCFGQTGSGKTYTLNGPSFDILSDHAAVQYRTVQYVSGIVHQYNAEHGSVTFKPITLRASYMEIYQENINDLLNDTQNLKCRWSKPAQAFFVENLMIVECLSSEDLIAVLQEGNNNRKRASHNLNVDSSRSHVIFTMYFERRDEPDAPPKLGRIHFVDLAGSEKLKDSESTGVHGDETKSINKSLFALGNVIQSLSKAGGRRSTVNAQGTTSNIVPYRDSTLTKLLMDSLGGSCRTLMIACISPSNRFTEESIRTIQYAQRTKNIVNAKPIVRMNAKQQSLYELKVEVEMLRKENAALRQVMGQAGLHLTPSALEALTNAPTNTSHSAFPPGPSQHAGTPVPSGLYRVSSFGAAPPQALPSSAPLPSPFQPAPARQIKQQVLPPVGRQPSSPFVPAPPQSSTPTLPAAHENAAMMMAERAQKDNEVLRDEVSQLRNLVVTLRTELSTMNQKPPSSYALPSSAASSAPQPLTSSTESGAFFARRDKPARVSISVPSSQDNNATSSAGSVEDRDGKQVSSAPPAVQTVASSSSLTDFGFRPAPKKAQKLQWGPAPDTTLNSAC